jgi:anaphase-promoting complex subunit 1
MQHHGIAQVVLERGLANPNVTAPAATVALTLMFLKTNDAGVAAGFKMPWTMYELHGVRPDLLQLRVMGRALVMWEEIAPTEVRGRSWHNAIV